MTWDTAPLTQVAKAYQPKTIGRKEMSDDGRYPVYGANGVIGRYSDFNHEESQLLLGCRGSCGQVNLSKPRSWVTGNAMVIQPDTSVLHLHFLRHFLAQAGVTEKIITGVAQPQITRKSLGRLMIPLPPLEEQRRIAGILDEADALRVKRRRTLELLDDLTQSIFLDMFGEPHPEDFRTFGEACARLTVGVVVRPASHYVEEGVPAIRTLNVKPGSIDTCKMVFVSREANDGFLSKSKVKEGDLLITRTGKPGTAAIVPPSLDGANCVDLLLATPNLDVAIPVYLEALMNSALMSRLVGSAQRGQIQKHLNLKSLRDARIPLPPIEKQLEFERRALEFLSIGSKSELLRHRSDELFASLESRAFSGEL